MYEFMHLLFFCDIDLKVYGDNKNGGYMKNTPLTAALF